MIGRTLPALALLGGCGTVFGLEHIETEAAPCGPYTDVTPVTITGVTDARYFSLTPDGTLAMVVGRVNNGPTLPVPLRPAGTGWEPDPALQGGLASLFAQDFGGANIAPQEFQPVAGHYTGTPKSPAMMAWLGVPQQLARYFFSTATQTWTLDNNVTPITDGDYDVRAGNVIVVTGAGGVDDIVRHTVQVKRAIDPTMVPNQILFSANTPPSFNLLPRPDRTRPLNDARSETGQGVQTESREELVYSAKLGNNSDLFASKRSDANDFGVGPALRGVNTDADELEPWVDATCSKLYFRRAAAGQPNDAGQIFVAE